MNVEGEKPRVEMSLRAVVVVVGRGGDWPLIANMNMKKTMAS